MKKHIDLECLLENAAGCGRYDDGDRNRIWDNAVASRKEAGRIKLKWLIPAAAAFTVLVTLCAAPQARAAMTGFFVRVFGAMDYLLMENNSRPENTAVAELVQSGIDADVKIVPGSLPENAWVSDLRMRIDEVLYDGQAITIKYTLKGTGLDGFDFRKPSAGNNTESYLGCETSLTMADGSSVSSGSPSSWSSSKSPVKAGNEEWKAVSQFGYSDMKLSGPIHVKFIVSLKNVTVSYGDTDSFDVSDSHAGFLEAYFNFDTDAGNASMHILKPTPVKHTLRGDVIATHWYYEKQEMKFFVVNRKTPIEGSTIEVVSVVQSPVETRMVMRFTPSEPLKEALLMDDAVSLLNIELMAGDEVVGLSSGASSNGKHCDYELVAPFIPEDVACLTAHVTFSYDTVFEGHKLELDEPVPYRIDSEHTSRIAECEVDGGTFDIGLTK